MKKLFLIDPNQTKIPTDSCTWLTYRFVLGSGIMKKLLGIVVLGLWFNEMYILEYRKKFLITTQVVWLENYGPGTH